MSGFRLSGTVVDARRVPVDGVQIAALDMQGRHVATTTATDGSFDLVLLPNTYKLELTDPQGRFYDLYFNSTSAFGSADTVVIEQGKQVSPITFIVVAKQRRRAAGR